MLLRGRPAGSRTGVADPLASFAIQRADQVMLVTTPEWVTATVVLEALSHLQHDPTTVAINKSRVRSRDLAVIEERFRAEHLHRSVTIPYDEQLTSMLDSGTYTLEALARPSGVAIKRLGLAVAEQLVLRRDSRRTTSMPGRRCGLTPSAA